MPETANTIDTVVWDMDNTILDWIKMHMQGLEAMLKKIMEVTGSPEDEVLESIRKVYGQAGTFDYKALVQNLDVVHTWLETIPDVRERVRRAIDLSFAVHTVYTQSRNESLNLYPGIEDVLDAMRAAKIRNVILSDAPLKKIIRRVKLLDIEDYFDTVIGQPEPMSQREVAQGGDLGLYEKVRETSGYYDTSIPHVIESPTNQRKPDINLAVMLNRTPEEVRGHVAVVGDNMLKDVKLAHNNGCLGLLAEYGKADNDSVKRLFRFGPPEVVHRNAPLITPESARLIQEMGPKFIVITDCRQITGHILQSA